MQSISQIAAELSDLQAKALAGTLSERDMQGGTFTLVTHALCYAMLCYAVFIYATAFPAVLDRAVLCCIVLCYAMLQ